MKAEDILKANGFTPDDVGYNEILASTKATLGKRRERIAVAALQGLIAGFDPQCKTNGFYIPNCDYPGLVLEAIEIADELIKQLDQ